MNPIENFKMYLTLIRNYSYETLTFLRNVTITFVFIDLIVFHWWLGWKKLALILFIIAMIYLAIILYAMKDKPVPKVKKKPQDPDFRIFGDFEPDDIKADIKMPELT